MSLLIDGYNLLHATGILGSGIGPGGLERSRLALLNFLAESIEPEELPHTTVVFDAHNAPWGTSKTVSHRGITVRFAAQYEEADDLIEELIHAHTSPRRLIVVSSDHRIQRAARRRKARAIDSDAWYSELIRSRRERQKKRVADESSPTPVVPLLEEDVNYWLRQFGGESAFKDLMAQEERPATPTHEEPASKKPMADEPPSDKPDDRFREIDNPFPPGYGEDLLKDL